MTRTSPAVRKAIRSSTNSNAALAKRYRVNPKTVAKWRARSDIYDRPSGPSSGSRRALSPDNETLVTVFRICLRLPLDDCLSVMRRLAPDLTRAALYRCFRRHWISRLEPLELRTGSDGNHALRRVGSFLVHLLDVRAPDYRQPLLLMVDRVSRWTHVKVLQQVDSASMMEAFDELVHLSPFPVRWIFADLRSGFFSPWIDNFDLGGVLLTKYGVRCAEIVSLRPYFHRCELVSRARFISGLVAIHRTVQWFNTECGLPSLANQTPHGAAQLHEESGPRTRTPAASILRQPS